MKIGLFFGSFNPVHCGHLMVANYCLWRCGLQRVWFVLSPSNPHKDAGGLLPLEQRMKWLRMAVQAQSLPFDVCDIEVGMPLPSYTADTMQALAHAYSQHEFSIIMGADILENIQGWKHWQSLLSDYYVLVYPRRGVDAAWLCSKYDLQLVDAPMVEISSTMLRQAKAMGADLSAFVPHGVDFFS